MSRLLDHCHTLAEINLPPGGGYGTGGAPDDHVGELDQKMKKNILQ